MVGLIRLWPWLAAAALLAGCDGGASAVPVHKAADSAAATASTYQASTARSESVAPEVRRAPVPRVDGKPMWSANRRFTAEQNAQRHFERSGADFGAKTVDAYVAKAHAFVTRPPKGAQILTRANGDRLIYDPAGNIFAVATRDGAPRTMFKPDDGSAYWEKVKAREAEGGSRSRREEG